MTPAPDQILSQLVAARIGMAKAKLEQHRPDEALPLLVSTLITAPSSQEVQELIESILGDTVWNFPTLTIDHKLPIDQISIAWPSTLWVSLRGPANTTVRWNLDQQRKITSVLFPSNADATRGMIFDTAHRWVVIQRGATTLLCDATTLKPIRDLSPLPGDITPSSAIVFSDDGLLIAHPRQVSDQDHSIVWHLRDCASGQILRSSEPFPIDSPAPLAACLNRNQLRIVRDDGSLVEIPVSPVEEVKTTPMPDPVKLLGAQFSADGNSMLALLSNGPHQPATQTIISYSDNEDGSLEATALTYRFPWSKQPNIWNRLDGESQHPAFVIERTMLEMRIGSFAPVQSPSVINAAAFAEGSVITGGDDGKLSVFKMLPLPLKVEKEPGENKISAGSLAALGRLSDALVGRRLAANGSDFIELTPSERLESFSKCDFETVREAVPGLDFGAVRSAMGTIQSEHISPETLVPLWDRLAKSDRSSKSWPTILELSKDITDSEWHKSLTAAVVSRAGDGKNLPADSPWVADPEMEEVFAKGDETSVMEAIKAAGTKGPAAAEALTLALASSNPGWIEACVAQSEDLPPLIAQIAQSRVAWLQGRKAFALAGWPEVFPKLEEVRLREDWDGWEQADFQPALDEIQQCVQSELDAIKVPENSTAEQRKAVSDRLIDPATVEAVGKPRFADACLKAALAFSAHKEETEMTFQLANLARNLGAAPEPCLRAEALALTAHGDFQGAHPRWIELITEHPVETHLPGDYAEAAYTAFENLDPRQAMEILTTGMHRFPNDGNFAMRAGWVALLTGNSERAYRFLREGQRIGFPPEKLENATALLVIAASQTGANDDAAVYFQDLLRIDLAWSDPATLDTLEWPEELKSTLGLFIH